MATQFRPFAHIRELDTFESEIRMTIGDADRIASTVGGVALIIAGLTRRSAGGLAIAGLGTALLYRGITGRCELCRRIGLGKDASEHIRGVSDGQGIKLEESIHINRPPNEVYGFWRQLSNLPEFLSHVQSVTESADGVSHWTVDGPAGSSVEWDAEIVNQHPNELLAWQTLPGADVENAGSVRFNAAPDGGTNLRVVLQYHPPAGRVGAAVANLFGESPGQQLSDDLLRLKGILEAES